MRVVIIPLVAVAGFIGFATPVQAAPAAPHDLVAAAPAITAPGITAPGITAPGITMVRQRCGEGMKRENAWRDKQGAWHGRCVPKRQ
jgi:hypothetical protein